MSDILPEQFVVERHPRNGGWFYQVWDWSLPKGERVVFEDDSKTKCVAWIRRTTDE